MMEWILLIMAVIWLLCTIIEKVEQAKRNKQYQQSEYYKQTHKSYRALCRDSGAIGEYRVYRELLNVNGYKRFLFNTYLPTSGISSTEIDIIFLHESGIYVIESKNFTGWIFGNENDHSWTQTLPARGRVEKHQFYNPIMQNQTHVKTLQRILRPLSLPIYSYIVFSNRCRFKDVTLTTRYNAVIHRNQLVQHIVNHTRQATTKLTPQMIDNVYQQLYPYTHTDYATKQSHINNVHLRQETFQDKNNITCPVCGNRLVIRTATKGQYKGQKFLGCSNYPSCTYTKNL